MGAFGRPAKEETEEPSEEENAEGEGRKRTQSDPLVTELRSIRQTENDKKREEEMSEEEKEAEKKKRAEKLMGVIQTLAARRREYQVWYPNNDT